MSLTWTAVRAGLVRGRIELRQTWTSAQDLASNLITTAILLTVMVFLRGSKVPGTSFSLGSMTLPGALGTGIAFGGLLLLAQLLALEREDGTLLRAKAIPGGMTGYLIGKIVTVSGMTLINLAIQLTAGLLLFHGLRAGDLGSWLTLAWVLLLGLVATLPMGAVFGSLFPSPRSMQLMMFPLMGLVAISGIFYPITHLPHWLQWIGQVFPIYWLGLGVRSALLPHSLMAVEIGHSWRHLETLGILSAWAVVGLAVAPGMLRRMARRESGSSVAARREKVLQSVR
jgi:ABC-2 type transport system permease protein